MTLIIVCSHIKKDLVAQTLKNSVGSTALLRAILTMAWMMACGVGVIIHHLQWHDMHRLKIVKLRNVQEILVKDVEAR